MPEQQVTKRPAAAGSVSFSSAARDYDRTRAGLARGRATAADVHPLLVPGPVLDIGAGTGTVTLGLRELGHRVVGVDLAGPMLTQARERLGPVVTVGDAQLLPVASDAVANTLFVHVLHLVGDMAVAMSEAARVLRPGGRLVALHGEPVATATDLIEVTAPVRALAPVRPDAPAAVVKAGRDAGLELVEQRLTSGYEQGMTPQNMIDSIVARQWSYLIGVDDGTWADTVEPVIAALRALPEPDRPRPQVWQTPLTVLVKPGVSVARSA